MAKKASSKKSKSKAAASSSGGRGRVVNPEVTAKLEDMAREVVNSAEAMRDPGFDVPSRTLNNSRFNKKSRIIEMGELSTRRQFFNSGAVRKFMQTMLIASGCKELADQGKSESLRSLFYHLKHKVPGTGQNTFEKQDESDPVVEDLEVTIDAIREQLGLYADNKGNMVGPMTIVDNGDTIDLSRMGSGGWGVPSIVEDNIIQFAKTTAKYVLLIEKGTVWNRFNQDRYWENNNCMIIHGGGQPPRGVRRLCYRMHHELNLPLYVLADNDPWGYYIYSVVKQGSINLAFESQRMAIPDARFIGMSSFDKQRFSIPDAVDIELTDKDEKRCKEIKAYPWFANKKDWQREIDMMLKSGIKLELEALSNINFSFITETYLPEKLKKKQWLD